MGYVKNGVSCDLYIGRGAGKMLRNDIRYANEYVKIISPYTSPSTLDELLCLHQRGISVELITSHKKGCPIDEKYKKIIRQERIENLSAIKRRNRLKIYGFSTFAISILMIIVAFVMQYYIIPNAELTDPDTFSNIRSFTGSYFTYLFLFALVTLGLRKKFKKMRIYNYTYHKVFPFEILLQNPDYTNFIHSKIFIIDGKTAYLGSLNYTYSGSTNNYESRIKFTDKGAIDDLCAEFGDMFKSEIVATITIGELGHALFPEPIN